MFLLAFPLDCILRCMPGMLGRSRLDYFDGFTQAFALPIDRLIKLE